MFSGLALMLVLLSTGVIYSSHSLESFKYVVS